jgi:hypothetical protein
MKITDHTMTLNQFLDYQRELERNKNNQTAKYLRKILNKADVTNPFRTTSNAN